jgi:putative hydrolase of the HAD superfamily
MTNVFSDAGIAISATVLEAAFDAATEEMLHARRVLFRDLGPVGQAETLLALLGVISRDGLVESLTEAIATAILAHPPVPFSGVRELLADLADRGSLGLISNTGWSSGRALRPVLGDLGLLPHFTTLAFSDEVGWAKPDARIFRRVLKGLRAEPETVLHVGDGLASDVRGAKALGMATLWLAPSTTTSWISVSEIQPIDRPDLVMPSAAEAGDVLRAWLAGERLTR